MPDSQNSKTRPVKEYIGDGVYVSMSYGDVTLETDRDGVRHWIVLEPEVYASLVEYVDGVRRSARAGAR